jgi:hypothetical protein
MPSSSPSLHIRNRVAMRLQPHDRASCRVTTSHLPPNTLHFAPPTPRNRGTTDDDHKTRKNEGGWARTCWRARWVWASAMGVGDCDVHNHVHACSLPHHLTYYLANRVTLSIDAWRHFREVTVRQDRARHVNWTCLAPNLLTVAMSRGFNTKPWVLRVGVYLYPAQVWCLWVQVWCRLCRPVPYPCGTLPPHHQPLFSVPSTVTPPLFQI